MLVSPWSTACRCSSPLTRSSPKSFKEKGLPIIGDDIKSQFGATLLHRIITRTLGDRGVKIERTYQLNTGGNTDFLNMLEQTRLATKKVSKTESVQSQLDQRLADENIHIGPSDYVPWQKDNKVCFLRMEWRGFGDVPMNLEARLSVEDSPNSAGVVIDAIRCAKLALDRKIGRAAGCCIRLHDEAPAEADARQRSICCTRAVHSRARWHD